MENTPTHLLTKSSLHGVTRHSASRKVAVLMAIAATVPAVTNFAHAHGYSDIASKEIARRSQLVSEADKAVALGREAYANKNFEEAHAQYQQAVNMLPPGPALADRRNSYTGHLGDAAVALAQKNRRVGKYDEARSLLEGVVLRDPANFAAKKQLEYLDDPIRTNPVLTYEHTQNVDNVRKGLYRGEGYFNLGKYDEAEGEFKKVLQKDKYNKAARRWLERIATQKSDYYRSAYDHTRAQLLSEVDRAWEIAVPPELPRTEFVDSADQGKFGAQYIQQKLNNIIIPVVDFDNTSVEEALDFLRLRARELDSEPIESKKGINFRIRKSQGGASGAGSVDLDAGASDAVVDPGGLRIKELKLRNVPLGTVLQYIVDAARLRYKIDEHSVELLPLDSLDVTDLFTRKFTVPPNFIASIDSGGGGDEGDGGDVFGGGDDGGDALSARKGAQELLDENGIEFPEGAFARYIAVSSQLVVRNTLSNLDIIEQLIESVIGQGPRQVRIMTKFIEISQENNDELGFDWVINPIGLGDGGSLTGGSTGNGSVRADADFGTNNLVTGNRGVGQSVTNGLRSGDFATSTNSIDSILNDPDRTGGTQTVAPGILSFTGLFGDGEFQTILRGLAQKQGTDVMTAPNVLARSGEKATIEVIREFIYPTEYEPPELPNEVDSFTGVGGVATFPVTPATPTAFETRNTGVTLEIEPTIGENNYTIDLRFAPELVEFEGFINYGSPIQTGGVVITENRIEMPVFSTRRVSTALTIYDGYTVAVGGLMSENVQKVEDKVPILGDLPLIGRLFQSTAENRIKSNLVIFVTAQIIDAAGAPINGGSGITATAGVDSPLDGAGLLPPSN